MQHIQVVEGIRLVGLQKKQTPVEGGLPVQVHCQRVVNPLQDKAEEMQHIIVGGPVRQPGEVCQIFRSGLAESLHQQRH